MAPNSWSLAQAFVTPTAWPRAIVAEGGVVGFLMLGDDLDEGAIPSVWLWRLMIGAGFQRRGYGQAALRLACDEVRRRGHTILLTSWLPAEDGPEQFYLSLGFVPTGEVVEDEVVGRLDL